MLYQFRMIYTLTYINHGFKFGKSVFNDYHDLLMMTPYINNIAIIAVKGDSYLCIIHDVSKSDAIHLLENSMLDDREFI